MPSGNGRFNAAETKRRILVAEDEMVNRKILGAVLADDYEVVFAEDGAATLEAVRQDRDTISLILLDLMMPKMGGIEVLKRLKEDQETAQIPVIVATADQNSEIECLQLGAIDFISKPYPQAGVIRARVQRTIELMEDRQTISSTERDPLSGLYNKEYFNRYVLQFEQRNKDTAMDAVLININHFRLINERYGKARADEILRCIGSALGASVRPIGGIACRRDNDVFLVYAPHQSDYKALLDRVSAELETCVSHVHLRMGVYENADKSLDIERRFDRAANAADSVRNRFTKNIGYYDDVLHEKELFSEQLIDDFAAALNEEQFCVFYQPKYAIRTDAPKLCSAEALVRWKHPTFGLIHPGIFIPLFEENGLIQQLDHYVWRKAAEQIREWRNLYQILLPVSVNVSRIDMYDPLLRETFCGILDEFGLSSRELLLEITESAYTQDSSQIIDTVSELRTLGFQIEMDDFGTGYSSLNMISSLPIDALKLDMQFIRAAFSGEKDTRLIEVIIDIAKYLKVPVIAEGVETEEQLLTLKEMGCDIVQGYYFSKPVPADEFLRFLKDYA